MSMTGKPGMEAAFSAPGILVQTVVVIIGNVVFVAVTAFCIRRYGTSLAGIGLGRPGPRVLATGFGIGLALVAGAAAVEFSTRYALEHLLPAPAYLALVKFDSAVTAGGMFGKIPALHLKILFALAGAIAAPIGEEIFFRGLLYNSLKRRLGVPSGIVISGLIFALIHFGPLAILVIFPMGMVLAYVYEKTGSLWVTICMHATNNGLAFALALAFPQSGEPPKEPGTVAGPPAKPAVISIAPSRPLIPMFRHAPGGIHNG
jgi:membrane protease YdiL (CAAX protease family)